MPYSRTGVLSAQSLNLRAVFTDDTGEFVAPDATPSVYIYDPSVDTDTIDAEIAARTFTSALAGPLTPTALSTGYYELNYTVPSAGTEGVWYDVWDADVDTVQASNRLSFRVVSGAEIGDQAFTNNQLVVIELDASITNSDASKTLSVDQLISFSTVYKPLYASPNMLRMELGAWVDNVSDDTLALLIHWSSREADFIKPNARCADLKFALARFVVFDSALKMMTLPGGLTGKIGSTDSGGFKKLGGLQIRKGRAASLLSNSAGIDVDTLKWFRQKRDEWWRVVNAGGCIVPGESFAPSWAIRGIAHPTGRRNAGRLWRRTGSELQPVANEKSRDSYYELSRFRTKED